MKIKRLVGIMLSGVLLFNTIPVGAYTGSKTGTWDGTVTYSYCSDGTLIIEGQGDEFVTSSSEEDFVAEDIKYLYFKNVDSVDRRDGVSDYIFSSSWADGIEYCYFDFRCPNEMLGNSLGTSKLKEVVFGSSVRELGECVFYATENVRVTIPSTVTTINDNWLGWDSNATSVTIVCEYGSEAYNWAIDNKDTYGYLSIELMDVCAESNVTLDNTQNYQIIVPESIKLTKESEGWGCDTFLGVTGAIESSILIKTSKTFNIVGEDIPSTEKVSISTDDENLLEYGDEGYDENLVTIKLEKDALANAIDDIEINDSTVQGYRIDYDCDVESGQVMKQVYTGRITYIVSE